MRSIMNGAFKGLMGVLIAIAGYWLKDNVKVTRKLDKSLNDLRVLMATVETGQSAFKDRLEVIERRLEFLEQKPGRIHGHK